MGAAGGPSELSGRPDTGDPRFLGGTLEAVERPLGPQERGAPQRVNEEPRQRALFTLRRLVVPLALLVIIVIDFVWLVDP